MAVVQKVNDSYGTYYYINSDKQSEVLTKEQQDANAIYIRDYCASEYPDWTENAIAAMCGNFAHEGVMNPSQWQYGQGMSTDSGFGLGQWTPATKILDFLSGLGLPDYSIPGQMERIAWEAANNQQWISTSSYDMTMTEFLQSEDAPADLASAWLYDWERPADPAATEAARRDDADYYFELFGNTPINPKRKKNGMPIWMYHRFKGE